jgi:uncharacterized membrane protein
MGTPAGWVAVAVIAAATIAIRAAGPVLMGGRPMHPRVIGVISLLAPSLLTALVATTTLARGQALSLDARALGVGVAGLALVLRAPTLVVVILAAAATAAARFLGWH